MNLAHVHLLLNHFPTVGLVIGLGLYLLALIQKSVDLERASLIIFFGIGMLTVPLYVTGNAAADVICVTDATHPCVDHAVSKAAIETHEGAALWGFIFMQITGVLSWLGLWQARRMGRVPRWNLTAILILGLFTFAVMARAADLGGEIRHPEITTDAPLQVAQNPLAREVGGFVKDVK